MMFLSGTKRFDWSVPVAGLLMLVSFGGCSVGPRYKRPVVNLAPFHNAPRLGDDKAGTSLDQWWLSFHDEELNKVVERALDQNLDLAASLTRVIQARAAAREAGARLLPTAAVDGRSTSFRQSLDSPVGRYANLFPTFDRNQSYLDLGVSASWEIDLFGGLRRGVEAATAETQAAEAAHIGVRVSLVAEAADAYMQIRGTQMRLAWAHRQIETDEHLLQLVSQRKAAGIASDREQAQAEALLAQARSTVPPLSVTLEAQLNRMDVLLGSQPGTYAAQFKTVQDVPTVPAMTDASTQSSDLLRRRPDIVAAERRVVASNARVGQALAEYYPKVSLAGLLGSEAISPGDLFRGRGFNPQGIAGLRWRLFDFGRVDAEVQQARGAEAEALLVYKSSVLRAAEDVEDSLSLLLQSQARVSEELQEIAALQRVRDRSNEAYVAGVIGLTDVLDADRQLLIARDELATSRETVARAAVGSFRALGGGWTP